MINRIIFLLTSILFLPVGALGQVPLNEVTYMDTCVGTNDTSLLNAAVSVGKPIVIPFGVTCATDNITISVPLYVNYTGRLKPNTGQTATLTSGFWAGGDTPWQAFTNALDRQGTVSFIGNKSLGEISISWSGAVCDNSANDTRAINAAFVAGEWFTVISPDNVICRVGSPPPIGSPKLKSHTVLRLGANSMFKLHDSAPGQSAALQMDDCEYCVVDGGVFDGNSGDGTFISSHAILIRGGTHLKLLNGRSQHAKTNAGSYGDGIYLGMSASAPQDVIVDKWTSTDNGRQAVSIIGCRQCRFTNNYFLNTKFHVEGAGMDFEPNRHSRQVTDLVINSGSNIVTSATANFTSADLQIKIGTFYGVIAALIDPNTVKVSIPSPLTNPAASGKISSSKELFEDLLVEGNTISGNAGPGIIFVNPNSTSYKGIRFVNNSIRNNLRSGLVVTGENTDGLIIAHNTIEGNRGGCRNDEQAASGIGLIILRVERGASVVGNTVANNDCTGIFITESSHVTLADNKIYRNGAAGIRIRTDTSPLVTGAKSAIHSNSIFNNGTMRAGSPGILLAGRADKNTGWEITNNMFGNDAIIFPTAAQKDGILFVDFPSQGVQGVIVGPNTYTGLPVGAVNVNAPGNSKFNPTFNFGAWEIDKPRSLVYGFGNNGSPDAILPASSTQGFLNIPAMRGTPTAAPANPTPGGVAALTADVTNKRFCWNVDSTSTWQCAPGSLTATQTLDFPSISANTSSELTVPVTGAAVGDVCYASPTTTLESGLAFSCYISSSNAATVRVGNVTTGAINPASRSWKVGVWKF